MDNQFIKCVKLGISQHYRAGMIVICDRCKKTHIKHYLTYNKIDLCLDCVIYIQSFMIIKNKN